MRECEAKFKETCPNCKEGLEPCCASDNFLGELSEEDKKQFEKFVRDRERKKVR